MIILATVALTDAGTVIEVSVEENDFETPISLTMSNDIAGTTVLHLSLESAAMIRDHLNLALKAL